MGNQRQDQVCSKTGIAISLFLLSAVTFLFEIVLTRLFAIAHFYHFAFMVVSLALLGTSASGSFLSLFYPLRLKNVKHWFSAICAGCGFSILGAYLLFNHVPFDAYAVMIEPRQILRFVVQLVALSMPFFFIGLAVNGLMHIFPDASHRTYAINLAGSALGCLSAPLLLPVLSGEGAVLLCCSLAAVCALLLSLIDAVGEKRRKHGFNPQQIIIVIVCLALIMVTTPESARRTGQAEGKAVFDLYMSPYKSLSYALQYPGALISDTRWNAFSRVDVVQSEGIRSLPGLSYLYPGLVKADAGLFVDGDNLSPVLPVDLDGELFSYLPQWLAYRLHPEASTLVIEPRGGLDVLTARAGGARSVTAVENNALLVEAANSVYDDPDTTVVVESPRSFLARDEENYDIIIYSLSGSFYPVTSGVFSLQEDYIYTLESLSTALDRLGSGGVLVLSRWLQVPPSEFLRAFILAVEALEENGLEPSQRIAALRGYNLGTLFVSNTPFTEEDLNEIRAFAESRAFDLVYLPGMQAGENNRFNILPEDDYAAAFKGYLEAADRGAWLREYTYEVSPPTDDRPFFGHFFKWSQTGQVLVSLGTTWQPFGGAGYLAIVFIFLAILLISVLLIVLPVLVQHLKEKSKRREKTTAMPRMRALAYFMLIGLGFMAVEIPMIQKFILLLGQPTYSFSAVLFTLLLASGLGSLLSRRVDAKGLMILGLWACSSLLWLGVIMRTVVGWPLAARFAVVLACLAPPGFLMGIAFPKGIQRVEAKDSRLMPWLWAVNGAASVCASVLCAMLAISYGFTPLLTGGGVCYLIAYALFKKIVNR